MKKFIFILIAFLIVCLTIGGYFRGTSNKPLSDYHPIFIPCFDKKGELFIAIRMYYVGNKLFFLVVNPYSFATKTAPATNFAHRKIATDSYDQSPHYLSMDEIKNTPYIKALAKYSSSPYPLQNYGFTEAKTRVNGEFLTVDMCPSIKPFESEFFKTLVTKAEQTSRPVPVGIAVTGLWIVGHLQEFKWLIQQEQNHKLQINWINHSFSHPYYLDRPFQENFLLSEQINFSNEVLDTEKLLIEHHQTPSVFFRFPGLVSNKNLVSKLKHFGLIPIGSNAWIAKDQHIKKGSVILVHGNSNEPKGIAKLMPVLTQQNINLLPLNVAFYKKV